MDTTEIRKAYADFLAVAEAGGFGPPPPGEWDAARILAHCYSGHSQIAATALLVAAGERPAYDNRLSLDEWNLRRTIDRAGDLVGMFELLRRQGEAFCAVAEQLSDEDLDVPVQILIISNDELVVDEPWPLRQLVLGVAMVHLPRHADQLRSLLPVNA
jgi:DinB superfamily